MASFERSRVLELTRHLSLFLDFGVGLVRGEEGRRVAEEGQSRELQEAREQVEEQRRMLLEKEREISRLKEKGGPGASLTDEGRLADGNIVWIFGSGRTGSTWLASMISEFRGYKLWNEPHVGRLFGQFYYEDGTSQRRRGQRNYIMGSFKDPWLISIRHFVLKGVEGRFPKLSGNGGVVIKEPNASIGAPLLSEALPGSRLVFLVRDPRDAVASSLDGLHEGGWRWQRWRDHGRDLSKADPDIQVGKRARGYLNSISRSREAYESHAGPKTFVRYEDLRVDPLKVMKRICDELELGVGEEEIVRAVEKHSWENIPEDEKGEGKQHRKASPGGWKDDLTPEQVEIVERETASLLEEFYPERPVTSGYKDGEPETGR